MFLADRTNGRAYAIVLRPSVCRLFVACNVCTEAKRCVLRKKNCLKKQIRQWRIEWSRDR